MAKKTDTVIFECIEDMVCERLKISALYYSARLRFNTSFLFADKAEMIRYRNELLEIDAKLEPVLHDTRKFYNRYEIEFQLEDLSTGIVLEIRKCEFFSRIYFPCDRHTQWRTTTVEAEELLSEIAGWFFEHHIQSFTIRYIRLVNNSPKVAGL